VNMRQAAVHAVLLGKRIAPSPTAGQWPLTLVLEPNISLQESTNA
jgi:hypothetical protein